MSGSGPTASANLFEWRVSKVLSLREAWTNKEPDRLEHTRHPVHKKRRSVVQATNHRHLKAMTGPTNSDRP